MKIYVKSSTYSGLISIPYEEGTYRYLVIGFSDDSKQNLLEYNFERDLSGVRMRADDFADKGYYLEIRNRASGDTIDISADDWNSAHNPLAQF